MPVADCWPPRSLNDEWLETEKKLQTMRRIIVPASLHDPQPITS